jgi:hypothetical protein
MPRKHVDNVTVPLYEGAPLFLLMINSLDGPGFRLMSMVEVFWHDAAGELMEINGIFVRR